MPLPRAVKRLELAQEDLGRLTQILRRIVRAPGTGPDPVVGGGGRATRTARRIPTTPSRRCGPASGSHGGLETWNGSRARSAASGRRSSWPSALEQLLGPRTARGGGGRRLLADLPARPGLILAEALLDRAPWLSDFHRAAFAWADLAICSVLLAEFALRLCLAPSKGLYFRRHFVIDFLASLPFGFLAYQLQVAHAEAAMGRAGETLRLLSYLRFGRLVQVVRYVRVVLPVLRLVRLLLFLLRLSDRLVRKHAGLLNRNIVLFEPLHAQPEPRGPPPRHRPAREHEPRGPPHQTGSTRPSGSSRPAS
ncbi:MAG: hypothetical protein U0790_06935 [Isosphaeraceae bacterium]